MEIIKFLVNLAGATMLLLFAVYMVRTGIERSFGASFQRVLTSNRSLLEAGLAGLVLAIIMQSSAAVTVLVTGFAAGGYLAFAPGLMAVLGADLGSALVIQILTFRLDWLVPVLLAAGGWMFVKSNGRPWRQWGRILMGVAFILIALQFLRDAMDPIRDSAFLPAVADYLSRDFVTAFIVGAVLALVMHSSVAAILMCVTLVQIGAIPFPAGLSLVMGANFGSAFIPVWLTRGMPTDARRIPFANLILRGGWAVICVTVVNLFIDTRHLMIASPGQSLIYAHIAFNLALFVLLLPFARALANPMSLLLPDRSGQMGADAKDTGDEVSSALDDTVIAVPTRAIAGIKRELLHMTETIGRMNLPVLDVLHSGEPDQIHALRERDVRVNATLDNIRDYVASLPGKSYSKSEMKIVRGLMEYAIRLKTAGDVIAKRLTTIAEELRQENASFSREGWTEITHMHDAITANIKLADNVLISDDLESARLLMTEKAEIKRLEFSSRKRHLKRLRNGNAESLQSSDMHLEALRAFRELNSHISAIAYPILYRNGQLLETRLIDHVEPAGG